MKKLFVSFAVVASICFSASAQEAFKHLSVGIDVGTTGIGVDLSLPVVTNHLVLKAGGAFPNVKTSFNASYDVSSFSNKINEYVSNANEYLSQVHGETAQFTTMPNTTDIQTSARVNLSTFKAILEYYPFKKSDFHISAGIYAGNDQFISMDGCASDMWQVYSSNKTVADNMCQKYDDYLVNVGTMPDLAATINGKTYKVSSPGNVNLGISVWKVRPYFGLGLGKSVPDTRCGFQCDLGVIYCGKLSFSSTNEVQYDPSVQSTTVDLSAVNEALEIASRFTFYPVLTFRFIVRLF